VVGRRARADRCGRSSFLPRDLRCRPAGRAARTAVSDASGTRPSSPSPLCFAMLFVNFGNRVSDHKVSLLGRPTSTSIRSRLLGLHRDPTPRSDPKISLEAVDGRTGPSLFIGSSTDASVIEFPRPIMDTAHKKKPGRPKDEARTTQRTEEILDAAARIFA